MKFFLKKNLTAIIIISLLTLIPVIKYWNVFSQPTDITYYEQLYSNSQYVLGEASPHKIDDNEVYIYAGYTYIRGDDPTAVNFEHTPLAKYFLGLSYLVTNNSVLFNIPLYFFTLLFIYILSKKVIKNRIIIYGILILIGTMRLFYFNVSQGMLDIPSLFATLLFFILLFSNFKNTTLKYISLGISLGIFAGTRYPFPAILLLIVPLLIWAFYSKELKKSLFSFIFLIITYLGTYFVYFKNHSIVEFPKFEWYRFIWFAGNRTIPKFLIFQTIFLGKFKGWWNNEWQLVSTWTIFWPFLFVGSVLGSYKNRFALKNSILLLYTFGLLSYYSIAAASYDRFLILIIPFWAIIFGIGIDNWHSTTTLISEIKRAYQKIK